MTYNDAQKILDPILYDNDLEISDFYIDDNKQGAIDWVMSQTGCDRLIAEQIVIADFISYVSGNEDGEVMSDFFEDNDKQGAINWIIEQSKCNCEVAELVVDENFSAQKWAFDIWNESPSPKCPKCNSAAIATVNETTFFGTGTPINVCQYCGFQWKPGAL